ncbi:MAG: 2-oxo-4-hydroxy-4-carboxy-5-ureidoimidazoline decarboxylase [Microcoleaceae cyanobacterium]
MAYSIIELNQMSQAEFTAALGAIFEETPVIASRAWVERPFKDWNHLYQILVEQVKAMSETEQLTLIRAHPDLGSRTQMAEASVKEQAGVGLDRLSYEDYQQFNTLNQAYRKKFNFPFIVAVKGRSTSDILAEFTERLNAAPTVERQTAIAQILKIAAFRLKDTVTDNC